MVDAAFINPARRVAVGRQHRYGPLRVRRDAWLGRQPRARHAAAPSPGAATQLLWQLADAGAPPEALQLANLAGVALGPVCLALWLLERGARGRDAGAAAAAAAALVEREADIRRLQAELEAERKASRRPGGRGVLAHARRGVSQANRGDAWQQAAACRAPVPSRPRTHPCPRPAPPRPLQARKDAEGLKPRLDEAARDIMKLERALEIKVRP